MNVTIVYYIEKSLLQMKNTPGYISGINLEQTKGIIYLTAAG